ncbi:hypothetical protein PTKIN_Ptkin14bG0136600 [Pterospermum kingtungense]
MVNRRWNDIQDKRDESADIWVKFKDLKQAIKEWTTVNGGWDPSKITNLEKEIQSLEVSSYGGDGWEDVRLDLREKKSLLWSLYRAEERMWDQKSRGQ